jgi:hypothetical protein
MKYAVQMGYDAIIYVYIYIYNIYTKFHKHWLKVFKS